MLFLQTAAPYGWTRVLANDDSLLRINGSTTPSSGGSNGFTATFNSQTTTGNFTITVSQLPTMNANNVFETYATGSGSGTYGYNSGTQLLQSAPTIAGSGGAHNHSITTSIKYVDALIAKKN